MAIDIGDDHFQRWLMLQADETRRDLELFWRREVVRHPYIKANPANAAQLRKSMVLLYAANQHDYDPAWEPQPEAEANQDLSWRSRWPKQQGA